MSYSGIKAVIPAEQDGCATESMGAIFDRTREHLGVSDKAVISMRNYLLRLGWGHGDDEIISTEQAIAWFDIDEHWPRMFEINVFGLLAVTTYIFKRLEPNFAKGI